MTINKSIKWGLASIAFLSLSLSGCYMDNQNYPRTGNPSTVTVKPIAPQAKIVEKRGSATVREPIQQVAPGPKRTAAPQLPVIP